MRKERGYKSDAGEKRCQRVTDAGDLISDVEILFTVKTSAELDWAETEPRFLVSLWFRLSGEGSSFIYANERVHS